MSIATQILYELAVLGLKPTKYQRFRGHLKNTPRLADQIILRSFWITEPRSPALF